jgi:hypothetical protein
MKNTIPNKQLKHSKGGATTRDAGDLGAPMTQGDPKERRRQGPEDAFDPDTRGDYAGRTGDGLSFTFERQEDGSVRRVQQSGKPEGS